MKKTLLFFLALFSLSGQAQDADNDINSGIEEYINAVNEADDNDIVLHQMQLGSYAFHNGQFEIAEEAFDYVLNDIESVFNHTEEAIQARSLWYEEGRKSFKGEPYERAMAYYYRGLLYLLDSDFGNARASFLAGQMQDAFAEEDQHRADFTLLMLMEAWAAMLMEQPGLVEDALRDFIVLRPNFRIESPDTHALAIVETGAAPRKLQDGVSGESLVFRRGKGFKEKYAIVQVADTGFETGVTPMEDIFFQSSTRGERVVDRINDGKAVYKSGWTDASSIVAELGSQMNLYQNLNRDYLELYSTDGTVDSSVNIQFNFQGMSLAASVVGMIAAKIKPRADNRYWNNLPDTVHIGYVPLAELENSTNVTVKLSDNRRQHLAEADAQIFELDNGARIVWYKSR